MMRSLGRRGIPILALGAAGSPGLASRFAVPVATDGLDDDALIGLLSRLGERLPSPGVLLPTDDPHVLLMSRRAETLGCWFRFVIPERATAKALADKRTQYALAAHHGIAVPRTRVPETEDDVRKAAGEIGFPLVLKPAFSHAWRRRRERGDASTTVKLVRAETPPELVEGYRRMAAVDARVVVQEHVPGGTDRLVALYAYCPADGGPLAFITRRKHRDWPPGSGNGSYSVAEHDPEIERLGRKLLGRIGYRGLVNIEFKRDARDDRPKLIEVNVRGASQLALAIDAGVDLPLLAYSDALGRDTGPPPRRRDGVRWIDFGLDSLAFRAARRRGELTFGRWVVDVLRARSHAYHAWDDPGPGMRRLAELARAAARGLPRDR